MISEIITAFVLGLVGGIVPGPVLAATCTEILQSGFLKSLRIIFWAMAVETVVAFASLLILSSFGFSPAFFAGLSLVGAGVLLWIANQLWKVKNLDIHEQVHFSVEKIAVMILANGVLWTYWITICIPKAISLGLQIPFGNYLFLFLVEIGWLISTVSVALVFSWFRELLSNPKVVPTMFKLFSITFICFALNMFYHSLMFFL